MPSVIVTGGAGFIGSHVVDKLISKGFDVAVIDNLSSGCSKNLKKSDKLKSYLLDLEKDDIESVFQSEKPDYVIHLAAQTSVNMSMKDPYHDAEMNILASIRLLELCLKYNIKKFITASTAAVYGVPKYLPIDENHTTEPMSPYGLSKLTMENYIRLSGVPFVIFRFSNAYGPRQLSTPDSGVIAIFNDAMKKNKDINIYGDGTQIRDFVYVEDVSEICVKALEFDIKNEVINFSTNTGISLNELFNEMKKLYNYKKCPIFLDERPGDIKNSILSNKKAEAYFDNIKYTALSDGLRKLIQSS